MFWISSLNLLAAATAHGGGDLNAALAQLDIQFAADGAALRQLPLGDIERLLTGLEARSDKQHFPFAFAEVFNFDGYPELAAFLISAQRLRDLGPLLDWIPELLHPSIRFEALDDGRWTYTSIHVDDPSGLHVDMPAFIELITAVVVRLTRAVMPGDACISSVQFAHAARVDKECYERFFACPVSFGGRDTHVMQESRLLDAPLPGSLPAAHAQAEESIRIKLMGDGVAPPLIMQVRDLLRQRPEFLSDGIEALAQSLKMNPRTLQRRLRAHGRRYSKILAQTRHELACDMLRDPSLDIESIGYKLGFSERRSFTQAFTKWQGQTPSAYRKLARGQ